MVLDDLVHFRPAYLRKVHLAQSVVQVRVSENGQMMVGKSNPCFFDHGGEIEKDGPSIKRIAVGHKVWIIVGSDWLGIQLFFWFSSYCLLLVGEIS